MPNPDLASERRAFEVWYKTTIGVTPQCLTETGIYPDTVAQFRWQGWLARSAVPTPDGYVLVPVEPTEAMIPGSMCLCCDEYPMSKDTLRDYWKAMIAASQSEIEPPARID